MTPGFNRVYVNHEGLIFRRGRIYPESFALPMFSAHFRRPSRYAWFLAKNHWLRKGAVQIPSGLWVTDTLSPGNYFHWVAECLPRLLLAEEQYPDEHTLLLPRRYMRDPHVLFTLRAFPQVTEVGWIGGRVKARVEQLALVPRPCPNNTFIPRLMRDVGSRVSALITKTGAARRIYFTRADAGHRRAVNEDGVVRMLRSHDFEIVTLDPANPGKQVEASLGARVIAGVHGAALTNMIFMPAGGRVLEFRHPRDELFPDCYRPLARAMGHEYQSQLSQPVRMAPGWEELNHSDLVIDLDALRETLAGIDG